MCMVCVFSSSFIIGFSVVWGELVCVCVCVLLVVCVSLGVCVRERDREREREHVFLHRRVACALPECACVYRWRVCAWCTCSNVRMKQGPLYLGNRSSYMYFCELWENVLKRTVWLWVCGLLKNCLV